MRSRRFAPIRLRWSGAFLALGLCVEANAQSHSLSLSWLQERIRNGDVVQRVARPSLGGLHAIELTNASQLQVSWDVAPSNAYVKELGQIFSDVDINVVQLSLSGRHGRWSWNAGIQPAVLDDWTIQPVSIYSADFAEETAVSEQLLLGLGWEGEYLQLGSAVFRRSPLDILHAHLGRHRPGMVWNTGLTDTKKFDSWLLSVESKDKTRNYWHLEYAHLSTNRANERDTQQWMASWSGLGPFAENQRWNIELGQFRHFRGTTDHARSAMLNWSLPMGTGALQVARAMRWQHGAASGILKTVLTELSYTKTFAEKWHLVLGASAVRDTLGKTYAVGLMASYTWHLF